MIDIFYGFGEICKSIWFLRMSFSTLSTLLGRVRTTCVSMCSTSGSFCIEYLYSVIILNSTNHVHKVITLRDRRVLRFKLEDTVAEKSTC